MTLEFGEPLDAVGGDPMLIADGWIEYPDAQTLFAAWQALANYHAPTIEARGADGHWQVIRREFGYPAGMPRCSTRAAGARDMDLYTRDGATVEPLPGTRSHAAAVLQRRYTTRYESGR